MRFFIPALGMLHAVTAMAADPVTPKVQPVAVFDYGQLSEVMFALGLVIVLIVGCGWIIRKLNGTGLATSGAIRVVAVLPLGMKEKLVLVQVGGRQLLLGVTPGQINTLQVFETPVVEVAEAGADRDFSARLKQVFRQGSQR